MSVNRKLWFLDTWGYPIECYIGKPIICFIRHIIHTRKIKYSEDWKNESN